MEAVRECADLIADNIAHVLGFLELNAEVIKRAGFSLEGVETHLEECEALTDAVVEFPGDAGTFLVLGYEETAAENPQLFPGTVEFGYVNRNANKIGRSTGLTNDIDDLMEPNSMAIGGEHAVVQFVIAAFLNSFAAVA
jgi:hypothetical protein